MSFRYLFKTFLVYLFGMGLVFSQTPSENHVLITNYRGANSTSPQYQVNYFDGLGRATQSISTQASPSGQDHIQPSSYDQFGRASKQHLPYPATGIIGSYRLDASTAGNSFYGGNAFTAITYENSPLNRVNSQTLPNGGIVTYYYGSNSVNQVKRYDITGENLSDVSANGYYAANALSYVKTTDEKGNISLSFKDKDGRVILNRAESAVGEPSADTYYLYNELGQLRAVLQPQYQVSSNLLHHAFLYRYNNRGLLVEKRIPGTSQSETLSYNTKDLLVNRVDANGRNFYYVYNDPLDRQTEMGVNGSPLLKTYYDSYPPGVPAYQAEIGLPASPHMALKGQVVATQEYVMQADGAIHGTPLMNVSYFDNRYRVIQTTRDLYGIGGTAREQHSRKYLHELSSVVSQERITYTLNTGTTQIDKSYTYDHQDRLLSVSYTITHGNQPAREVVLSAQRYDELGRLSKQYLYNEPAVYGVGLYRESIAFDYTIRSWLKSSKGQYKNKGLYYDNFGINLNYESNGNISQQQWRTLSFTDKATNTQRVTDSERAGYGFYYDGLNRLKEARGIGQTTQAEASPNTYSKVSFGATELLSYDLNGNIGGLSRWNIVGEEIDNLWYNLEGNRLKGVLDNSGRSEGFLDNGTAIDYSYDGVGNVTNDGNRGAVIAYNALNLPRQVSINGKTIGYDYSSSGQKVRMQNGTKTITYAGLLELDESNYVTRISTEEGQVIRKENDTLQYQIYLKDHLGNVRNVIDEKGTLIQETEYYPFGLQINKTPTDWTQGYLKNRYLYLNREVQPETGWLDLIHRGYDPTINRFLQVDPKPDVEGQERLSTYQYGYNNPIRYSDPNGDCPACWEWMKKQWNNASAYFNKPASQAQKEMWSQRTGIPQSSIKTNTDVFAAILLEGVQNSNFHAPVRGVMNSRARLHETAATTPAKVPQKATFLVTPDGTAYHNPTNSVTTNTKVNSNNNLTPNTLYTQVASSDPNVAVQNTVTNSKGQIVSQVDFKNHGIGAESGHAHVFPPNQINMGHHSTGTIPHIPYNQTPVDWLRLPTGVTPSKPIGN